jgi:hypothetical protein
MAVSAATKRDFSAIFRKALEPASSLSARDPVAGSDIASARIRDDANCEVGTTI